MSAAASVISIEQNNSIPMKENNSICSINGEMYHAFNEKLIINWFIYYISKNFFFKSTLYLFLI